MVRYSSSLISSALFVGVIIPISLCTGLAEGTPPAEGARNRPAAQTARQTCVGTAAIRCGNAQGSVETNPQSPRQVAP
jgi:hypothetical protein